MKQTSNKPKTRSAKSSKGKAERTYKLKRDIAFRAIEGQILVLAPREEFLYTLNESGKLLWAALQRGTSKKRLAALLVAEYGLSLDAAKQDVETFLRELAAKGMIATQ